MPKITLSEDERRDLGRQIVDGWEADNLDRQEWLHDLPRWIRAYQGKVEKKDLPWPDASNLFVPVTATVVDALHPRLMSALWRPDPVVGFRPQEPSDEVKARKRERFLDWAVREEIPLFGVSDRTILSMLINGVALTKQTWELKIRHLRDRHVFPKTTTVEQALAAIYATELQFIEAVTRVGDSSDLEAVIDGRKVKIEVEDTPTHLIVFTEREEIVRDAPRVELINPEDVAFNSDCSGDLQEADHLYHRYWLTLDEVKRKVKQGTFQASKDDLDTLELLAWGVLTDDQTQDVKQRREDITGAAELNREGEPEKIELLDAYLPYDVNDDGYAEEVIVTVPHEKPDIILRLKRLEEVYRHGMRPFVYWGLFPVANTIWSLGIPQILDGLQTEFNAIHNQRVDAGELANTPYGWYVPSGGHNPEKVPLEPGFLIPVDDINSVKMATPANWTAWSEREEAALWALVERRTKVSDLTLGRISEQQGASRTATGVQQLSSQQAAGFDILIRRVQESFRHLLRQLLALYAQYMPPGKELRVLGKFGEPDAIVSRNDLQGDLDLVFTGNALSTDRDLERQSFTFLSQQIMNPQTLGFLMQLQILTPVGVATWFKHLLGVFDVPNRDRIIQVPPEVEILTSDEIANRVLGGERMIPMPQEDHAGVLKKLQQAMQLPQAAGWSPEQRIVIGEQLEWRQQALVIQQMQQQIAAQQMATSQLAQPMPGQTPGPPAPAPTGPTPMAAQGGP